MARQRDFGATKRADEFEALNFTLNGVQFDCKPAVQGATLLSFVASANADDPAASAAAINTFFRACLTNDSYEAFVAMTTGDEVIVEMENLTEIVQWLIEEYTARPTKASKG